MNRLPRLLNIPITNRSHPHKNDFVDEYTSDSFKKTCGVYMYV